MSATALSWEDVGDLVGHVPGGLLASPWIARLAGVSFLGALDAAPGCVERTSRLDHSVGAARLALAAARSMRLDDSRTRLLVTSAFLHDVGHWPFSHSAEAAFDATLGADHHELSRWMLVGGGPVARARSLAAILESAGVDPPRVQAIIEGEDAELSPLLTGAINVDTLEGIPRAARAFGLRGVRVPSRVFVRRGDRVMIDPAAVDALDRFWRLKDRVYRSVINSAPHASFELRFASVLARELEPDLLGSLETLDDAALRRTLTGSAFAAPRVSDTTARYEPAADPSTAPKRWLRRYEVDTSIRSGAHGLPAEDWARRWTSRREHWFLVGAPQDMQMLLPRLLESEGTEL